MQEPQPPTTEAPKQSEEEIKYLSMLTTIASLSPILTKVDTRASKVVISFIAGKITYTIGFLFARDRFSVTCDNKKAMLECKKLAKDLNITYQTILLQNEVESSTSE